MIKKLLLGASLMVFTLTAQALELTKEGIVDSQGNVLEAKEYERVIILDPAVTETFYMIGAEDKIVAIGKTMRSSIYPEDKTKELATVGNIVNPSLEKILSYSPDLVILGGMATKTGENLKKLNIPYLVNSAENIDEILTNILAYGHLTGQEKEAGELYTTSKKTLEELRTEVQANPLNLKGGILYSTAPMMGFNSKALPGQIMNLLGVQNITDGLVGNRPIISQEYLLQEDPDFLAGAMSIKTPEDIMNSNPIIKEIKAGKNKNIFIIDSNKILRASPRIFIGIKDLYNELKNIKK